MPMIKQNYIITDPDTRHSISIEATSSAEAVKKFLKQKKEKEQPKKEIDLNGDGKFDSQDASLAGEVLNQAKSIKQS